MRTRCISFVLAIPVIITILLAPASAANQPTVKTRTASVAAFKNGLGFFLREGEALLQDGWAVTDVVPNAALGTFWIGSSQPGVTVERLTAYQQDIEKTVPAVTISEMLAANVGKRVRLTAGDKIIEGTLVAAPEDRNPGEYRSTYPVATSLPPAVQGQLAIIETNTGTMAINKNSISWVEFFGKASPDHVTREKEKRFRFKVTGANDKAKVAMGYLQKGISWTPAYLIDIVDDKKARITMQGLLANDVEDIDGAAVSFVVGYPNFAFSNVVSPLAMNQDIAQFISNLQNGAEAGRFANRGITAQIVSNGSFDSGFSAVGDSPFGYTTTGGMAGTEQEDLFFYHVKDVSLRKGERAYYTVFTAEVPYEHIYECIIPDTSYVQPTGWMTDQRSPRPDPVPDQVWHKLRFTNTTDYPWTTAPAMAMQDGRPLSQDTMRYASKGAKATVDLTVATDIAVKKTETEKSRQPDALHASGTVFAKVTADGTISVRNYRSKPTTVTIKKNIIGEVISTGANGQATKTTEGFKTVNPVSVITWEVPLKPGESKDLDYTYSTYVHY